MRVRRQQQVTHADICSTLLGASPTHIYGTYTIHKRRINVCTYFTANTLTSTDIYTTLWVCSFFHLYSEMTVCEPHVLNLTPLAPFERIHILPLSIRST